MKRKAQDSRSHEAEGLQKMAQSRAAEQAMAVDAATLDKAVSRFVEWEAFTLWIRAIVAAEHKVPDMVTSCLRQKCPGFLESRDPADLESLWSDLLDWIETHVFRDAACDGWLDALTYTARRQPASQKAWRLWEQAKREWGVARPTKYPTFEAWLTQVRSD